MDRMYFLENCSHSVLVKEGEWRLPGATSSQPNSCLYHTVGTHTLHFSWELGLMEISGSSSGCLVNRIALHSIHKTYIEQRSGVSEILKNKKDMQVDENPGFPYFSASVRPKV